MKQSKVFRMVGMAMLTALVVVLQLLGGSISFGSFSITLVLIPVVIGAALFGPSSGAFLGAVFGVIVYSNCINGSDIGGHMVYVANPFLCAVVCIGKGIASGYFSGLAYRVSRRLMQGNSCNPLVREYISVIAAAIVAPIVNTGLFCVGMILFFRGTLSAWAAGTPVFEYIIFGLAGINFLIEMGVNLICAPAVVTILRAIRKDYKMAA